MRRGVYKIDGSYYRVRYQDKGFRYAEDRGLWRADKVEWTGTGWRFVDCPYYDRDNCQMDLRNDLLNRMKEYKKIREAWIRMHEDYSKIMRNGRR